MMRDLEGAGESGKRLMLEAFGRLRVMSFL